MPFSWEGRAPWRVIAIQVLILAGLAAFFKFYLPHRARDLAARAIASREQKIVALFQDAVVEDSAHEISVPLDGRIVKRHPQRLRTTFSPQEAETALGVPDASTTDFQGGQHLTWSGTSHTLEASFNAGRLYCLNLKEISSGHWVMVFEALESWHPY
jgi:hypothetical protein